MEKIAVCFAGKTGTTERCANLLANRLGASLFDLCKETPNLAEFDTVVIGGSIRMGLLHKKAKLFMEQEEQLLLTKKLGLFLCCCDEAGVPVYFKQNFLPGLREHALFCESFGGTMNRDKLHGFDRCLVTMVQRSPRAAAMTADIFKDRIKACAELLQPCAEE